MRGNLVNRLDYARIKRRIIDLKESKAISQAEVEKLLEELHSATIVNPMEVPMDIVTMNSVVKVLFLYSGKEKELTIVYPEDADMKENKISILSTLGIALFGGRAGEEVDWDLPFGTSKVKILGIKYQPESAGHFDL